MATASPSDSPPTGDPGGVPGGAGHGNCADTGTCEETEKPVVVPLTAVQAQRIAGTEEIPLPVDVKMALVARHESQVVAMVKLCLSRDGAPTRVQLMKSTGFAAADERIREEVSGWRYRPYRVNGNPVPICTAVTFRYQIQ